MPDAKPNSATMIITTIIKILDDAGKFDLFKFEPHFSQNLTSELLLYPQFI